MTTQISLGQEASYSTSIRGPWSFPLTIRQTENQTSSTRLLQRQMPWCIKGGVEKRLESIRSKKNPILTNTYQYIPIHTSLLKYQYVPKRSDTDQYILIHTNTYFNTFLAQQYQKPQYGSIRTKHIYSH